MTVYDTTKQHLDRHPETWFTAGMIERELAQDGISLSKSAILLALKRLTEEGYTQQVATGLERYDHPKWKFRKI